MMFGWQKNAVLGGIILFVLVVFLDGLSFAQLKGDVNGDGVIDGKDALLVYQQVKGVITLKPAEKERGDVHPLPGTNGRVIGDGQITEEDALKLLRYVIGLVSRGEVSGQIEGPFISEFEPTAGGVGAKVALRGFNFISNTTDNVVKLSGVDCRVLSAKPTELLVEIPAGAQSGPFTVTTPGGTATSSGEFTLTKRVSGRLVLPGGGWSPRSASEYRVLSSYDEATPDEGGNFELGVGEEAFHIVVASPKGGGGSNYLGMYLPEAAVSGKQGMPGFGPGWPVASDPSRATVKQGGQGLVIDAFSTAVTLLYINPAIFPKRDFPTEDLIDLIRSLPETEALGRAIADVFPTNPNPLADVRIQEALRAALQALSAKLPRQEVMGLPSRAPEAQLASTEQLIELDINATWMAAEKRGEIVAFTAGNRWVTPVNWFVRVIKLNPDQFKDGWEDLKQARADRVYLRTETVHTGVITARGVLNLFANLAAWIRGLVEGIGISWPPGTTGPDKDLSTKEDAIYLIRCFSGAFYISDPEEGTFLESLPSGLDDHNSARLSNLVDFVLDFLLAVCGVKVDSKVANVLANVLAAAGKKFSARNIVNRKGAGIADYLSGPEIVAVIFEAFPDMMDAFSQWVLEGNVVGDAAAEKGRNLVKMLKGSMPVISQVTAWGRVVERVLGMAGVPPSAIAGVRVTPLETAIVVVGNPWAIKVINLPKNIWTGKEVEIRVRVEIHQEGLGNKVEDYEVFFGGKKGKVVSLTPVDEKVKVLKVTVPELAPGQVYMAVKVGRYTATAGPIQALRFPIIEKVTPERGFASGGTWEGQPFNGTKVTISGRFFDKYKDKVFFAGQAEAVIDTCSTDSELVVRVGWGAESGKIVVQTPEGLKSESPIEFTVLGKPELIEVNPTEGRAGDELYLTLKNLPPTEARVRFQYDGEEVYGDWTITDAVLIVYMPSQVPEGRQAILSVVTPAGASNGITVRRLAGRAEGTTIEVTSLTDIAGDGKISLSEAVRIVQGTLDPFAPPYDDTDYDVVIIFKNFYRKKEDGSLEWIRSETTCASCKPRGEKGHADAELAYTTIRSFKVVDGQESFIGESYPIYSLDDTLITTIREVCGADRIPGIGKYEEGDFFSSEKFGKDFADKIYYIWREAIACNIAMDLLLTEPGAGGDQISFVVRRDISVVLKGNVVIGTDDNRITVAGGNLTVTGRITVTGNHNLITPSLGGEIVVEGGMLIHGGSHNIVSFTQVGSETTRIAKGFEISGGARENSVSGGMIKNCDVGFEISEGAQRNTIHNTTKIRNCGVGLKISSGARENISQASVQDSTGDGVIITGRGTDNNECWGSTKSGGNGVHLMDGAQGNLVGGCSGNKGHGVLIEGAGTDHNQVSGSFGYPEPNGQADVAVVGNDEGSPVGTVIRNCYFCGNKSTSLFLQNLRSTAFPSVVVRENKFANSLDSPDLIAIVLDNVQGALLERNEIDPYEKRRHLVGILMRGKNTTKNVSRFDFLQNCSFAAVHITDGASQNRFENLWAVASDFGDPKRDVNTQFGVLIDGGASENVLTADQNLWVYFRGTSYKRKGGVIGVEKAGVMIRGNAQGNEVNGYRIYEASEASVVIEGKLATANVIQGCILANVIVRDGASSTVIGSDLPGNGNFFTPLTVFAPQINIPSILIKGADTQKVAIYGNVIHRPKHDGIVIEGAQGVRIGVGRGSGYNQLLENEAGIRLKGARDVVIANNVIVSNRSGVIVEGGSTDVTIGGASIEDRNIIIENGMFGIQVIGPGTSKVVIRNNILRYNGEGVVAEGGANGVLIAENSIELGSGVGIEIRGSGTKGNMVEKNGIVENGSHGVLISDGAESNILRDNMVWTNGGYGIVLGTGVDKNTVIGGSIAGNKAGGIRANLPAPPKVTLVLGDEVKGEVPDSVPRGSLVQVYADRQNQGEKFLGQAQVYGKAWRLKVAVPEGMNITATVTDPDGNTSAFGQSAAPVVRPALFGQQMLVFTSTRDGNPNIYARLPGDIADRRLTEDTAADHSPALSRDGSAIAFVSERSGNPEIWLMNSDGSFAVRLTDNPAPDYDPSWSPDGKKIAFVSERDGNPEIYVMNADGTGVKRLTNDPGVDRHPSWSPDGTKIAFTSERSGNAEIWVMDADGSNATQITKDTSPDYDPAWSPDGRKIAFVSEREGKAKVYLMEADGSNPTAFAIGIEPTWSPDGNWVAFTSTYAGDAEIFAGQVGGERVERLTVSLGMNTQPAWGISAGVR